jgi:hypothetical protein
LVPLFSTLTTPPPFTLPSSVGESAVITLISSSADGAGLYEISLLKVSFKSMPSSV